MTRMTKGPRMLDDILNLRGEYSKSRIESYKDDLKQTVRVGDTVRRFTWAYDLTANNGRGRSWKEHLPGEHTVTAIYRDGSGYRVTLGGAPDHKAAWTIKVV